MCDILYCFNMFVYVLCLFTFVLISNLFTVPFNRPVNLFIIFKCIYLCVYLFLLLVIFSLHFSPDLFIYVFSIRISL